MLNYIWSFLILISLIIGAINGKLEEVTKAAIDSANFSVKLALGLIGVMAFWLGIMKIAEKAGFIKILAKTIKPITKFLFPDIPNDHPALGSILMNMSANFLGLGNAATPLGLKAMEELQSLNKNKKVASNAMVTFLAMNTACPVLIPATVIAIRSSAGSQSPTAIIGTTLIASLSAFTAAITASKILEKLSIFSYEKAEKELENEMD